MTAENSIKLIEYLIPINLYQPDLRFQVILLIDFGQKHCEIALII